MLVTLEVLKLLRSSDVKLEQLKNIWNISVTELVSIEIFTILVIGLL